MSEKKELARLRSRVGELEALLAERAATDQIHEVEFRSLVQDVALKAAYIEQLERAHEEVVAPKDVHIRNLEAMVAQLTGEPQGAEPPQGQHPAGRPSGRIVRRLRGAK